VSLSKRAAYDPFKRAFDVVGALIVLILTLPIQLVVAVLVAARLGRPVFFRQVRPGRDGKLFTLLKFRTMIQADAELGPAADNRRLTGFGKALRSTSLDELPTLINVFRGQMSMVGPRPLLPAYLNRYTPTQARRHEVRPGITGLAQVRGRNSIDWETKFEYDVEYVDNRSLGLDARILFETVTTVLRRDGISAEGAVTMDEFRGEDGRSSS